MAATETPQATSAATLLPTLTPSSTAEQVEITEGRVPYYQLTVLLKYDEHFLWINEILYYTNTTGIALEKIPFIIPPTQRNKGFNLEELTLYSTQDHLQTDIEDATLWVTLPEPLEPDKFIGIELTYTLKIPEGSALLSWTDRQLLLTDWFPFIPPWLPDTGWMINQPSTVGEYLTYPVADYDVYLYLESSAPLVTAASLPLYSDDYDNSLHYSGEAVRNVTFAFSPEYLQYNSETKDVTIKAYVFPEHKELGQRAADLAIDAWALYENLFGENTREYMAIIEADLDDGMEYDGAFLLSQDYFASADASPQNYFELLIVHETAHQWFYAQIANDQANEPWLDESLATYSELLYIEHTYPDLVNWWWNYRVYSFQPTGWVNSNIYDLIRFRPYVNAIYLRGVQFLDALRQRIGDEAFFAALRDYATPEGYDTIRSTKDFFDRVALYSQEDISDLVKWYFRDTQP